MDPYCLSDFPPRSAMTPLFFIEKKLKRNITGKGVMEPALASLGETIVCISSQIYIR